MTSQTPFGKQFRQKYFAFDPEYTPLNNGSFGASPIPVKEKRFEEMRLVDQNADKYLRFTCGPRINKTLEKVAPYVGVTTPETTKNLVFVTNATIGVNTVLRSFPFKKNDIIINATYTYGACAKTATFLSDIMGIKTKTVNIQYPITSSEILNLYEKAIDESLAEIAETGKETSTKGSIVVFFDAICSQPGCKLPWKQLVALCKQKNVISFVDAAHGVGLLTDIDLENVRPDFFITNLHKWFYVPAPAALLYVDQKYHSVIQSFPISHTFSRTCDAQKLGGAAKQNMLIDKFVFIGTEDYSRYLATEAAIDFRKNVCGGEENIRKYTYSLAKEAAELFSKELGTEILTSGEEGTENDTMTAMVNVFLPQPTGPLSSPEELKPGQKPFVDLAFAATEIQSALLDNHNVFVPIGPLNGKLYARLSAQVYLDINDFKTGLEAYKTVFAAYEEKYGGKQK